VMYNGFSDKGALSAEWFEIVKNFLKLAFAGDHREAKCQCNRCWNRRMLSEYEMSGHIANYRFMPNNAVPCSQRCSVERTVNFSIEWYKS
jgi:hypothetical protein